MAPGPDAVHEQLERILGSATFTGAGRHSRLLRYVVERTLAGEGDQLKEYVLGTEVFDRADSYDPRLDSIVRVEARRLRSRLDDYYRGPGVADPVIIAIPRGSYTPTFAVGSAADTPPATPPELAGSALPVLEPAAPAARSRVGSAAVLLGVVALVGFTVIAVAQLTSFRPSGAHASGGPGIAVLPFQPFSTHDEDVQLAARLTDAVTTELARLRTLSVASRTSASRFRLEAPSTIAEIRAALGVDFVMEASATNAGGTVSAAVRIVDAVRDRKVWVGEYTIPPGEVAPTARQIAQEASDAALKYQAKNGGG